jgi:PhnB protein
MTTKPIPDGYDSLIPSIVVGDAAKAIAFYKEVFGATERMRMNTPDGQKIAHAELQIRSAVLMLCDECPQMDALAPPVGGPKPASSIMVYVADVDAVYSKALASGAQSLMPVTDMFWGDRFGKFVDPFGHVWGVATHTRDVTPQECAEAAANWGKS